MIVAQAERRLGPADVALVLIFLVGIYLGVQIQVTAKVPFPAAPSGLAGIVLLWRRRDQIVPLHLGALVFVLLLYVCSVVSAESYWYLNKRFTGLIQLTYALVIGYAIFLTIVQASRDQIATLLLGFCLVILVGCMLEEYGGLRPISDAVRLRIYNYGIYDADLRDVLLYGRIRPRLFTSEPSAVTFSFTLFAYIWYVVARWRYKLLLYLGLLAASIVFIPGPTLMLGLLLIVPYELLLAGRNAQGQAGLSMGRLAIGFGLSVIMLGAFIVLGQTIYAARMNQIVGGNDPSFFYRVIGPALTAIEVVKKHPWAGCGLTAENFVADEVLRAFGRSPDFSVGWRIDKVADVLTNYFWLHWIYLGFVWGIVILGALTFWLKVLGAPSALFCWMVWAILGQASGAYVSPKTWTVFFLAAAASVLVFRDPKGVARTVPRAPRLRVVPARVLVSGP